MPHSYIRHLQAGLTLLIDIVDLSSIFYLGNSPSENPMFHYVLPLVDSVLPIRFALAGSASCHIAARTSDEALERKSLQLRVHATRLMREIIQSPRKIPDQTILASILMLAQLDVRTRETCANSVLMSSRCVPEIVSNSRLI